MPNYKNSKIYKIVSDSTDQVYYGSSTQKLSLRFSDHKASYKIWTKNKKKYTTSYEIIKHGDSKIILVEKFPCDDKDELRARERYHIENNNCINKHIPTRSKEEYRKSHKSEKRITDAIYRKNNIEELKRKNKIYREANKYEIYGRARDRYNSGGKIKILQRNNEYRNNNREEINRKRREIRAIKKDRLFYIKLLPSGF